MFQSQNPSRIAFVFVFTLTLVWGLIPTFLFPNPPLDVVISYAWSRDFALGYTQHPPLLSWLLDGAYRLTGGVVAVAYWLSQLSMVISYWMIWLIARRLGLTTAEAFFAIVINSVTFYFTLPTPEFNHNIIQIPIWLVMIYLFHRAITGGRLADWLLLGVVSGVGLLSKYSVALLIGCIGLYALVFADVRRYLLTPGPYVAALIGILVFVPHALWLVETDFLTFTYAVDRTIPAESWLDHLLHPIDFLLAQIGALAPALLVIASLLGLLWRRAEPRAVERERFWSSFQDRASKRFALWFLLLPLSTVLIASFVTGSEFRHMWGVPMFGLLGIAVVGFLAPRIEHVQPALFWGATLSLHAVFLVIVLGQALIEPLWKTKPSRVLYPGAEIAEHVSDLWQDAQGTPLTHIAGDTWVAGNVTLFSPDRPHLIVNHSYEQSPWIDPQEVSTTGVMLIWTGEATAMPDAFKIRYPDLEASGTATFNQQTWVNDAAKVTVSWAIIKPEDTVTVDP